MTLLFFNIIFSQVFILILSCDLSHTWRVDFRKYIRIYLAFYLMLCIFICFHRVFLIVEYGNLCWCLEEIKQCPRKCILFSLFVVYGQAILNLKIKKGTNIRTPLFLFVRTDSIRCFLANLASAQMHHLSKCIYGFISLYWTTVGLCRTFDLLVFDLSVFDLLVFDLLEASCKVLAYHSQFCVLISSILGDRYLIICYLSKLLLRSDFDKWFDD